jgi:hypothetical protein
MVLISLAESLAGRPPFRPRARAAFKPGNGALPDQITFEFGERGEDMKDQFSGWRASFYFLRQRFEVDPAGFQFSD